VATLETATLPKKQLLVPKKRLRGPETLTKFIKKKAVIQDLTFLKSIVTKIHPAQ